MADSAPAAGGGARRRIGVWIGVVLVVAFALRVAHIFALRGDVLFEHPQLDEELYVEQGRAIAAALPADGTPYWQPPGLAFLLAGVTKLFGSSLLWPRLVQALLSTLTVALLYRVGRRLWSQKLALIGAAVCALHGVLIYETGELLPATCIGFLFLAAIEVMLTARDREAYWARVALAAATGLTLGLTASFSPQVLVFAPVAAIAVAGPGDRAGSRGRRAIAAATLLVGVAVAVAPVTARNRRVSGEAVLISTNGGINLYLGNVDYPNLFELRPGRRWDELARAPDADGVTRPGAKSHWFTRRTLDAVAEHPGQAVALYARKVLLFFHGAEIPRDSDVYAARAYSPVVRVLVWPRPWFFPGALIMPLALVGAVVAWRQRRRTWPLLAFFTSQAALTCAFFVTSRHRAPLVPLACLLAVIGAHAIVTRWPALMRRARAGAMGGAAAALVVCAWPLHEATLSLAGELDFYRGRALAQDGRDLDAAAAFERAAAAAPHDGRAWFELGNLRERQRDLDAALDAWRRAGAADPADLEPRRRAARLLEKRGDDAGAARELEASIAAGALPPAAYAHEQFRLAVIDVRSKRLEQARARLEQVAVLNADYFRQNVAPWADAVITRSDAPDPAFWRALAPRFDALGQRPMGDRVRAYADALDASPR